MNGKMEQRVKWNIVASCPDLGYKVYCMAHGDGLLGVYSRPELEPGHLLGEVESMREAKSVAREFFNELMGA